jgi:hypothetical protein
MATVSQGENSILAIYFHPPASAAPSGALVGVAGLGAACENSAVRLPFSHRFISALVITVGARHDDIAIIIRAPIDDAN